MHCLVLSLLALVVLATPSYAFVSKLGPYGGPIPCHQLKAAVRYFIKGTFSGAALLAELNDLYLETANPPQEWSAEDNTDNTNLAALINGIAVIEIGSTAGINQTELEIQELRKLKVADDIESACAAAEHGSSAANTPAKFRLRVGLPTNP